MEGSATRDIAKKDYFARAIEVYNLELPDKLIVTIDANKIKQFKSIKLVKCVMSYVHVYFTSPSNDITFTERYQYIKRMINSKYVRDALPNYYSEVYKKLGRYDKCIVNLINKKSVVGLYLAITYSMIRNKSIGGKV